MNELNPAPTPNPAPRGWLRLGFEAAIVAALAIVTFWKSLPSHFLTSDYDWLSLAKYGSGELEYLKKTLTAYRQFAGDLFSYAYQIFGDDSAMPYRASLLAIHIVNSILCGRLASRILQRPQAGWIAAALFVVSPASAEAVHSISAFVYPCITLLLLIGLLLYDQSIEQRSAARCVGAFVCFGFAAALREHWVVAFPLVLLLEIVRGGGIVVFKTRGPWLRLGPALVAGAAFLIVRHIIGNAPFLPNVPEYHFDPSMISRLAVTLERLVLPPVPLGFTEYELLHKAMGAVFIIIILIAVAKGSREDRLRSGMLLIALLISLAPFLPVFGDHIRQRFAYFGTVFASALAAYVICLLSEKMSPRVTLPIVAAILVGLLLEQQAEFERDYTEAAKETQIRIPSYRIGAKWVRENDDISFYVNDRHPNFVGISSMFRVLTGASRKQVLQIKASNAEQLYQKFEELKRRCDAAGVHRIFLRGPDNYDFIRVNEVDEAIRHIFETGIDEPKELTIFVLLPRPLDTTTRPATSSAPESNPTTKPK